MTSPNEILDNLIESQTESTLGDKKQKKILDKDEYDKISEYIASYRGLSIDCEIEMLEAFPNVDRYTIKSILELQLNYRSRAQHFRYEKVASKCVKLLNAGTNELKDPCFILNIAKNEGFSPVSLCRAVLHLKYKTQHKMTHARLLKFPHLITDPYLSANVTQCLCSDGQDGPLVDLRRRLVGAEYEIKLRDMAIKTGLHFYDENDLRRMGYDKTPDLKMMLPFLYKNQVVNWLESKALFSDVRQHKHYIQSQLSSYTNRFGAGIVIYWFGFHKDLLTLKENAGLITILDDFPKPEDITQLDLEYKNDSIANYENENNPFGGSIDLD